MKMAADIVQLASVEQFDKIIEDRGKLFVVHFEAKWAHQCQHMNSVLEEAAKQLQQNKCTILRIEAEDFPTLSLKYEILAVPTFIFLKNIKVVARVDGANAPELTKLMKIHGETAESEPIIEKPKEDLNERLKKLVKSAPCILFMKGNIQEPRCGFSREIVQILKKRNAEFSSFDILSDNDVRQGLKEFSQWPTFPQLYVNGEFIGGLDIVKELEASGELESILPHNQLDKKLRGLINQAPVMVFIKGTSEEPLCGFSKQLVSIFKDKGVKFQSFDILQDEEVRQGLKIFSNWPTYPQVYVNGNLVGGLDIIKELVETGELESTLSLS